jgi:hypothetical protein
MVMVMVMVTVGGRSVATADGGRQALQGTGAAMEGPGAALQAPRKTAATGALG